MEREVTNRPSNNNAGTNLKLAPPLKWAGGKRWLLPYVEPLWSLFANRRLVEPFCGGLAISLGLRPQAAHLNDINPHLINFYRWLKSGLVLSHIEMENDSDCYYRNRELFNALVMEGKSESQKTAGLFYYMNRTGFNGLCRFNQKGKFNVPFGRYKTINYVTDFREYKGLFAQWEFTSYDFAEIETAPDDFIYADPPYDVEFTQYSKGGFGWEEQVRLVEWLVKHPGPAVLSNQATPRIMDLYQTHGFGTFVLDAPRRISCNGDRTPAKEVLAIRGIEKWQEMLEQVQGVNVLAHHADLLSHD
jgi:DNA adenine methylase